MTVPKQVLSQLNDTNARVAIEYHRGLLAADLKDCNNGLTPLQKKALAELATDLLRLAETGATHLVQRRNGPGDYSYYAIQGGTPGPREKDWRLDRCIGIKRLTRSTSGGPAKPNNRRETSAQ